MKDKKKIVKNKLEINPKLDDTPDNTGESAVIYDSNQPQVTEALNVMQRIKRAQIIRRMQPKLKRAREMASKRLADESRIQKRAIRAARKLLRDRITGRSGVSYDDMQPAQKMKIDQQLETKVALIKRLAIRIVPKVRKAERERFSNFTHKDMVKTEAYDNLDGADDTKSTTRYKKVVVLDKDGNRRVVDRAVKIKSLHEKIEYSLKKKSVQSGIALGELRKVLHENMSRHTEESNLTREQFGFSGLNRYIAMKKRFQDNV